MGEERLWGSRVRWGGKHWRSNEEGCGGGCLSESSNVEEFFSLILLVDFKGSVLVNHRETATYVMANCGDDC
jgi:hypothetical protein